jgi:hypothetical protein
MFLGGQLGHLFIRKLNTTVDPMQANRKSEYNNNYDFRSSVKLNVQSMGEILHFNWL